MKVISVTRKAYGGIPSNFTLGESPVPAHEAGNEPNLGPAVAKIVPMRKGKLDFFPDDCYVIHFNDSTVRRIVPVDEIVDIAYDTAGEEKKIEVVAGLPEGDN